MVRSLVVVRPTVVFGEGNRGNVYQLIHQIISGRFVMVGSGKNRKSIAYVGNLSAFLVRVLGLGTGVPLVQLRGRTGPLHAGGRGHRHGDGGPGTDGWRAGAVRGRLSRRDRL